VTMPAAPSRRAPGVSPHFAALFPGQLSEKPGMGEALAGRYDFVADFFAEVSRRSGVDLEATFFGEGSPALHDDLPAQVGVFAVSVAALDALERVHGLTPAAAAGYSLGTYAAFVAAGALDRFAALDVLLAAHRLLEEDRLASSGRTGGMGFVIGLAKTEMEGLIAEIRRERGVGEEALSIGTENATRQLVLTGERAAVEAAVGRAGPRALKAGMLPITVSMHSPRLAQVTGCLKTLLEGRTRLRTPSVPLYAPMLARRISSLEELSSVLFIQLARPSLWAQTLTAMDGDGVNVFAEVGPGDVLTRLLRWTLRDAKGFVIESPESAGAFAREMMASEMAVPRG